MDVQSKSNSKEVKHPVSLLVGSFLKATCPYHGTDNPNKQDEIAARISELVKEGNVPSLSTIHNLAYSLLSEVSKNNEGAERIMFSILPADTRIVDMLGTADNKNSYSYYGDISARDAFVSYAAEALTTQNSRDFGDERKRYCEGEKAKILDRQKLNPGFKVKEYAI